MAKETKDKRVTIRITETLYNEILKRAEQENRTLSNYLSTILEEIILEDKNDK